MIRKNISLGPFEPGIICGLAYTAFLQVECYPKCSWALPFFAGLVLSNCLQSGSPMCWLELACWYSSSTNEAFCLFHQKKTCCEKMGQGCILCILPSKSWEENLTIQVTITRASFLVGEIQRPCYRHFLNISGRLLHCCAYLTSNNWRNIAVDFLVAFSP